jgi:hypothetical protein
VSLIRSELDKQKDKPGKRGLFSLIITVCLALIGLVLFTSCSQNANHGEPGLKAAIIDQLYLLEPNQDFIDQAKAYLEANGFDVDVYQGKQVSVSFYQQLPKYRYQLIIFRAHSGLMQRQEDSQVVVKEATYLFSGETYTQTRYVREQLTDQILPAKMVEDYPSVFAVNSKFLLTSMAGRFEDTAIIMMGCGTTYLDDMAGAFVLKGASTYIGWDSGVGIGYVDEATFLLLKNLCIEGLTVKEAIAETMAQEGTDPSTGAGLKYYPKESGDQTIKQLIGWESLVKASD